MLRGLIRELPIEPGPSLEVRVHDDEREDGQRLQGQRRVGQHDVRGAHMRRVCLLPTTPRHAFCSLVLLLAIAIIELILKRGLAIPLRGRCGVCLLAQSSLARGRLLECELRACNTCDRAHKVVVQLFGVLATLKFWD